MAAAIRCSLRCTSKSYLTPSTLALRPIHPVPCQQSLATSRPFTSSQRTLEKRYTPAHEWVELSPDSKTATFGISAYAAKALGDVVFVELPSADTEVQRGDAVAAVESVKSASDIYAPLGGKVLEANDLLAEKPGLINQGPEGEGWIARLEVQEEAGAEVEALMDEEAYRRFTEEEEK